MNGDEMSEKPPQKPTLNMGVFIALGVAIGVASGFPMDNLDVGNAISAAIGAAQSRRKDGG